MDSFRLNVFLESTRFKSHKKSLYISVLALYTGLNVAVGASFMRALFRTFMFAVIALILLGTFFGRALITRLISYFPWEKVGYMTVNIIGCEPLFEKTPPFLFLNKTTLVNRISSWIKLKTGAPEVTLVWAGTQLSDDEPVAPRLEHGSNVIAVLHKIAVPSEQEEKKADDMRSRSRVIRSAVVTQPDYNFTNQDDEVPSFIYDMFSDDDSDSEDDDLKSFAPEVAEKKYDGPPLSERIKTWVKSKVKSMLVDPSINFLLDNFGDTGECVAPEPISRPIVPEVVRNIPSLFADSDSESDAEEDEAPSFLREMMSDSDTDDDEPLPPPPKKINYLKPFKKLWTKTRNYFVQKAKNIATAIGSRLPKFSSAKVSPASWIKRSHYRDMLTLEEDPVVIRYIMPCRRENHAMSKESLLQYCKNKVLTEKCHVIECPEHSCPQKAWAFEDIRAILRYEDGTPCDMNEVRVLERELSANYLSNKMNCQRCPNCEIAQHKDPRMEGSESECLNCEARFCWACRVPWLENGEQCVNSKCLTAWKYNAAQMLSNCPRKHLDHMDNVPTLRACPTCGQLITHVTACKHMRCSLCKTRFCFICMKPQKDGNWQCGYDAQTCKLADVQKSDALSYGDVSRSNLLERISPEVFQKYEHDVDLEQVRAAQQQFMDDVMASVRNQTYWN